MSFRVAPTFAEELAGSAHPLHGMWICSGSPLIAEICAGAGLDWLLIDSEHSPNGLESLQAQLQAVAASATPAMVRVAAGDTVLIKQTLDLGAQNILVPMVDTAEQARAAVSAMRYPPLGVRGVGSALARASRWNRVEDYLARAHELVSLFVQVETAEAVRNIDAIAAVDGVDGVFLGPSDLAASLGHLGQQNHPEVIAAVEHGIRRTRAAGKPAGVNAFDPEIARRYREAGATFILVGADVALLARSTEALAALHHVPAESGRDIRPSY